MADRYWEVPSFGGRGDLAVRCRFCRTYLASWGLDDAMTWTDGGVQRKAEFNLQCHFLGCTATPIRLREEAQAFLQRLYPNDPRQWALRSP